MEYPARIFCINITVFYLNEKKNANFKFFSFCSYINEKFLTNFIKKQNNLLILTSVIILLILINKS